MMATGQSAISIELAGLYHLYRPMKCVTNDISPHMWTLEIFKQFIIREYKLPHAIETRAEQ